MKMQTLMIKEKNLLKKITKKTQVVVGAEDQKIKLPLLRKGKQVKIKIKRSRSLESLQAVVVEVQGNYIGLKFIDMHVYY